MALVKPVGKKGAQGLPPWILIVAGVGLLVVLAIIAFVVVSGNLGTTTPKKGTPKNSIRDTSMRDVPNHGTSAAVNS